MFGGWADVGFRECSWENGLRRRFPGESLIDIFFPCRDFLSGSRLTIYSDQHVGSKVQIRGVWGSKPWRGWAASCRSFRGLLLTYFMISVPLFPLLIIKTAIYQMPLGNLSALQPSLERLR